MFGVGGALGMVVAGPLTDVAGPAALFWLAAVLALLALTGMVLAPSPGATPAPAQRVDLVGAGLIAGTLVTLLRRRRDRALRGRRDRRPWPLHRTARKPGRRGTGRQSMNDDDLRARRLRPTSKTVDLFGDPC
ncbi:hypothetical protein ACIRQQ_43860 [Streptomyces fuscichromogenes]|uniref:hypothetical protein n=1 Tax=Streptomyces fuscichromogenes TaxID=1324013 RepID=UPI00380D5398